MTVLHSTWLVWVAAAVLAARLPGTWRLIGTGSVAAAFLASREPQSAALLGVMTVLTFLTARHYGRRTVIIIAVVVGLLGLLAAFKIGGQTTVGAVIPLGMSYYTFRCIHYLLERLKRRLPPHTFAEFFAYLFFLPSIIAGPIHRFPEFHKDIRRPSHSNKWVSEGLERILYGYAKIVILANYGLQQLDRLLQPLDASHNWLYTYLTMIVDGLDGYLRFAGYSDVAIGAALLMGFRIIENFNNPFISRNIIEFWRRWHISLSSWVREYLYTTIFSFTRRPYLAALVSMLAIGLWHEISSRYILWGLAHGAAVALCQWYQRNRNAVGSSVVPSRRSMVAGFASWLTTFHFVMLSFVLVRHDLAGAALIYRTLLGLAP